MQATGSGTPDIKLIATDLDGTLIGSANEFPLYSTFRDRINDLQKRNGVLWAACTGRSYKSFWAFFSPMRTMGLMPDYVVIRHAYIFGLTRFGYLPHIFWNLHIRYQLWLNKLYVREAMNEWQELMTGGALGVSMVHRKRNRLCLRFDSDESANVAADLLRDKVKRYKHLKVFRYRREVDVREVPYTKGLAVTELAAHINIGRDNILAIGNGSNDISMLEGDVAAHTGCPVNSEPEVMEVVHKSGGHIASGRALSGVMEILEATLSGNVRNDLPEGWRPPEEMPNPLSKGSPTHNRGPVNVRRSKAMPWIIPGVIYAVLVAFASAGLVPYSNVITKPFFWFRKIMEKVLGWLYS